MKLSPEVLRFAFLIEKTELSAEPRNLSLTELFEVMNEFVNGIADDLDSKNHCLREGVNPRLFAEDCAVIAKWALYMVDNINQLPITRHGLIEAMNEHCV